MTLDSYQPTRRVGEYSITEQGLYGFQTMIITGCLSETDLSATQRTWRCRHPNLLKEAERELVNCCIRFRTSR
ncbi:hypothetical protein GJAV_G00209410 [Gymnothorax javanicus]|nr:hypothetical protein GJAV_G00209410 [Gymnothorax javanicus]